MDAFQIAKEVTDHCYTAHGNSGRLDPTCEECINFVDKVSQHSFDSHEDFKKKVQRDTQNPRIIQILDTLIERRNKQSCVESAWD